MIRAGMIRLVGCALCRRSQSLSQHGNRGENSEGRAVRNVIPPSGEIYILLDGAIENIERDPIEDDSGAECRVERLPSSGALVPEGNQDTREKNCLCSREQIEIPVVPGFVWRSILPAHDERDIQVKPP